MRAKKTRVAGALNALARFAPDVIARKREDPNAKKEEEKLATPPPAPVGGGGLTKKAAERDAAMAADEAKARRAMDIADQLQDLCRGEMPAELQAAVASRKTAPC